MATPMQWSTMNQGNISTWRRSMGDTAPVIPPCSMTTVSGVTTQAGPTMMPAGSTCVDASGAIWTVAADGSTMTMTTPAPAATAAMPTVAAMAPVAPVVPLTTPSTIPTWAYYAGAAALAYFIFGK